MALRIPRLCARLIMFTAVVICRAKNGGEKNTGKGLEGEDT